MRRRPAGGEGSSWWRGGRTSWWINVGGDDSKLGLSVVRCDGGGGDQLRDVDGAQRVAVGSEMGGGAIGELLEPQVADGQRAW
jgi:hypothetical protein